MVKAADFDAVYLVNQGKTGMEDVSCHQRERREREIDYRCYFLHNFFFGFCPSEKYEYMYIVNRHTIVCTIHCLLPQ